MPKIAHLGAGSAGFGKRFLTDVMTRPSLQEATLTLMDINPENLEIMTTLAQRMAQQLNSPIHIEATTDRRRALDGADYVIVTIVSNGFGPRDREVEIPQKYGVYHSVGCTTGPARHLSWAALCAGLVGDCPGNESALSAGADARLQQPHPDRHVGHGQGK